MGLIRGLLLLTLIYALQLCECFPDRRMTFAIEHTWDSDPVSHDPIRIVFAPGGSGLLMQVYGPFFNEPGKPPGHPGVPFPGLWNYEVAEAFFLDSTTENYLEVEVCPHGQHLVLLLSGAGHAFKDKLPMVFTATITGNTWRGEALIPWAYFPPNVNKLNLYAIHGAGKNRTYEALYPVPKDELEEGQQPNFHLLQYFKDFRLQSIMGEDFVQPYSEHWEGKDKPQKFEIKQTWNSDPVDHEPISVRFTAGNVGLNMQVSGPFFNDPGSPPGLPGYAYPSLWYYEVVEAYFLDSTTENYLEVVLCPHGQHLIRLLSGVGHPFAQQLPVVFTSTIKGSTWSGQATIPWTYFPPNVNKMNSYAVHGSGAERTHEALYPVPKDEITEGQKPNAHLLKYFKDFRLQSIMGDDWVQPPSDFWNRMNKTINLY